MRLFIALNIPDDVKKELIQYQPIDSDVIRIVDKNQFHITLHFLGNFDFERVDSALQQITANKFQIQLNGLGQFQGRRKTTTLWAGIKFNDGLAELHQKIASELRALEIKIETRQYTPHITLARCKNRCDPQKIEQYLQQKTADSSFSASEFCLYQSELHGDGPRYKMLNGYALN